MPDADRDLDLRRGVSLARLLLDLHAPKSPLRTEAAAALAEVLQRLTLPPIDVEGE